MKWKLSHLRSFIGFALLIAVTLIATAWVVIKVAIPAYLDPSNRTYTTHLGYPALMRQQNKPFPVTVARAQEHTLRTRYLGEGLVNADPLIVPIVHSGRISHVYVKEGDIVKRGQLLAELDTRLAEMQIARLKLAIQNDEVALERTKIGSPVVMPKERPDIDEVSLKVAQAQEVLSRQLNDVYDGLLKKGALSVDVALKEKQNLTKLMGDVETAKLDLKMSKPGRELSIKAAELALQEAKMSLERQLEEFKDYKIYSLGDAIVDQVLIHEGEFKQGNGNAAFTLVSGRWFTANLDQTTIGRFKEGDAVDVRLEAFPGTIFPGHVEKIKPIVTYNQGGPEADRPIRPLGTGSPEWPATFQAKIALEGELKNIVPGLTGFAEVHVTHQGTAIPTQSLTSVSAGKAIAFLVQGNQFKMQQVTTGIESDGWIEILSGLNAGDTIITKGHEILQPGDRIAVSNPQEMKKNDNPTHPLEKHSPARLASE